MCENIMLCIKEKMICNVLLVQIYPSDLRLTFFILISAAKVIHTQAASVFLDLTIQNKAAGPLKLIARFHRGSRLCLLTKTDILIISVCYD